MEFDFNERIIGMLKEIGCRVRMAESSESLDEDDEANDIFEQLVKSKEIQELFETLGHHGVLGLTSVLSWIMIETLCGTEDIDNMPAEDILRDVIGDGFANEILNDLGQ